MPIALDHTVIAAADNALAARRFADTMGVACEGFDGIDGKFAVVRVNDTLRLFFMSSGQVVPQHLAFQVDGETFDRIRQALERAGQPFGNRPNQPDNGRTDHPLCPRGLFWRDPDGHLFEVMTAG